MKSLEDLLKESSSGTSDEQEIFAAQFNEISNLLYYEYGVRSVHMALIIRDILIGVASNIDKGISYYTREMNEAKTRLMYNYWDGLITGLRRAKYLLFYFKEWNLPPKIIYKEDKKQ